MLPPELKELRQALVSDPFPEPETPFSPPSPPGVNVRSKSNAARARCPSAAAAEAAPDDRFHTLFSGSNIRLASRCTRRERRANKNGDIAEASKSNAKAGVRALAAKPGTAADITAATACGTCNITNAPVKSPTRAARDSSLYRNNEALEILHRMDVILDPLFEAAGVQDCTVSSGAARDGAELTAGKPFLISSFDLPSFRAFRKLATDGQRTGRSGGRRKGPNFLSFSVTLSGTSIFKVSPSPSSIKSGRFTWGS